MEERKQQSIVNDRNARLDTSSSGAELPDGEPWQSAARFSARCFSTGTEIALHSHKTRA